MKINRIALKEILNVAQLHTSKSNDLIQTNGIMFQNPDIVMTTNLETSFIGNLKIEDCNDTYKFCLPFGELKQIISNINDEYIIIEWNDNNIFEIICNNGKSIFKLKGYDPDNFPQIETPEIYEWVEYDVNDFLYYIDKLNSVIIDMKDNRSHIQGIYFNNNDICSTNGSSLVLCQSENKINSSCLVPKNSLLKIASKIDLKVNNIKLFFKDNFLFLKIKNHLFMIRCLEGNFPNYQKIIDKKTHNVAVKIEDGKKIKNTLNQIKVFASQNHRTFILDISDNKLKIAINNPELGDGEVIIDKGIEIDSNENIYTGFNVYQFYNFINNFNECNLYCDNNKSPLFLKSERDDVLSLIMPMKI